MLTRRDFLKTAAIGGTGLVAMGLAGCSSGTSSESGSTESTSGTESEATTATETTEDGGRTMVTVDLGSAVNVFNPISKWNPYLGIQYAGVYERLGEREQQGSDEFKGVLMESWEETDGTTYDCFLYDYIYDSDGNNLTAYDVEYSVEAHHDLGNADSLYIESIEVVSDYEFIMHLTTDSKGTFELVCETCWIATQAALEKAEAEDTICAGTGPYVCTEFISGSTTRVEKRDDYWQTEELTALTSQANVDVIVYNTVSETTQMAIDIENPDSVQISAWLNESIVSDASEVEGVTVESLESIQMKCIIFNASEYSDCQNEALRKAICYAINSDSIVQAALSGIGTVPATFGNATAIGYNTDWEDEDYYSYDLDKAKELLAESGIAEGTTLKIYGTSGTEFENSCSVLKSCLAAIGLNLEIVGVESASQSTYLNDLDSGWDIFVAATSLKGPYLIQTYAYYVSNDGYNNQNNAPSWGVYDEEFQALVDKAYSSEGTQEDLDEIHDYVIDNCYVYQWYGNYYTVAHVDEITNIVTNFKNNIVVGACTFSDSYSVYAD